MNVKTFWWVVRATLVLVLAAGVPALAQAPMPVHLSGLISDVTPAANGSWDIRGEWSLRLKGESGTADFSAALTMERSDYWFWSNSQVPDATSRSFHTHHITIENAIVTPITNGFEVSGSVSVTGNGNPAPFSSTPSTLTVDITGGSVVQFSNITLTFSGGAAGHFGSQTIHGVVLNLKSSEPGEGQ